jgi:hypothetical protein
MSAFCIVLVDAARDPDAGRLVAAHVSLLTLAR